MRDCRQASQKVLTGNQAACKLLLQPQELLNRIDSQLDQFVIGIHDFEI